MSHAAAAVAILAAILGTVGQARTQARTVATTPSCAEADQLSDAGKLALALTAYENLGSTIPCAATGIAVVQACQQGEVELEADRGTQAATDFEKALGANPEATCASRGLDALKASWFNSTATSVINWLEDALTLVGIGIVLVFGLLLFGWIPPVQRLLLAIPHIRYFVAPRLSFNAFDDSAGSKCAAALSARIEEELMRQRDKALNAGPADEYDLDLSSGVEAFVDLVSGQSPLQNALTSAGSVSDQTKLVAAIIGALYWLLPIQRLTVSGVMEQPNLPEPSVQPLLASHAHAPTQVHAPADPHAPAPPPAPPPAAPPTTPPGPGQPQASVTLLLQDGNRQNAAVTLWASSTKTVPAPGAAVPSPPGAGQATTGQSGAGQQSSSPPADDYFSLASPGAVWLQYQLADALSGSRGLDENEAESYALVQQGFEQQLAGDYAGAETSYVKAIYLNACNWGAYVNRAILEVRRHGQPGLDPVSSSSEPWAVVILDGARTDMREHLPRSDKQSATKRRSRWQRLVRQGKPLPLHLEDPNYFRLGYQLAAQRLNAALRHHADPRSSDWLAQSVEAAAEVIADANRVLSYYGEHPVRRLPWRRRRPSPPEERLRRFLSGSVIPGARLIQADARSRQKNAPGPDTDDPNEIVRKLRTHAAKYSYRVHYNLACYEANWQSDDPGEISEMHSNALADLHKALQLSWGHQRQEIVEWSQADPSLASLRKESRAAFQTLILQYQATVTT